MPDYKDLDARAIKLAKQIIKMCTVAGSGHPSSSLSLLHLTIALMYRQMRYDPKNPWNTAADRLVLSEGHAVPVIYAAYCDLEGVAGTADKPCQLNLDDTLSLRKGDSVLDGHPNPIEGFHFFDAATGSLGQGLSVAAGLAQAARLDGSDKKIYCMIGDGESREGQVWEALDYIVDHKLTAVRAIFSCNGQGQSDYVSAQQSAETITEKLTAYNFDVKVIDGHNWDEIFEALSAEPSEKPIAIVAKTVKGWSNTELQDKSYHGKTLGQDQMEQAIADLDTLAAQMGLVEDLVESSAGAVQISTPTAPSRPQQRTEISAGSFEKAMTEAGFGDQVAAGKLSTRKAYGAALAAIGAVDERIVALDCDVRGSTFANIFSDKYPDRFFEGRIAEQNMVSAAVGLSAAGKIPFASSFGKFLVRGYDQLEMAVITGANIKLCGSHCGVSLAADGPSQMALPDVAFMRSLAHTSRRDGEPNVRVFLPCDAVSTFRCVELMANLEGLCYMRTHRPEVDFIYGPDETFTTGGSKQLTEGTDLAIVASGYMVHIARAALQLLDEVGLSASLIDAYSIPLETEQILAVANECRGQMLVVEDNYIGGIADEITAAAAASDLGVAVNTLYVRRIPKSAKTADDILKMLGLTAKDIAAAAQKMFDQSQ